jgi:hypothetical protein
MTWGTGHTGITRISGIFRISYKPDASAYDFAIIPTCVEGGRNLGLASSQHGPVLLLYVYQETVFWRSRGRLDHYLLLQTPILFSLPAQLTCCPLGSRLGKGQTKSILF